MIFQLTFVSALVASAMAGNYGYGRVGGCAGGCGGARAVRGGFIGGRNFVSGYAGGVIPAAVQTRHNIQYVNVPSGGILQPIAVEIGATPIPINMVFHSASSQLNVRQQHVGSAGSFQETSSQDEAHVLRHTVTKPVIQEIREIVTPFRKVTQEIRPVQEQINTIVARGVNNGQGVAVNAVNTNNVFGGIRGVSSTNRFVVNGKRFI